jgi:hypothetical protein
VPSRDDDRDNDLPRRAKKKEGGLLWLWILLGCGGASAIACIPIGVIAAWFLWPSPQQPPAKGGAAAAAPAEPNPKIKQMAGLLAYWSFDEVQGDKVIDHSGRNNHLKLVGARIAPGIRGNGVWFDGQRNQYCEIPAGKDFNFGANAPFTFAGWFKTPMQAGCVLSLTAAKGPQQIDFLVRDNRFIVVIGDNEDHNAQNAFVWSKIGNNDAWHHFAITRKENTAALWIDSNLQGKMNAAKSGGPITTDLRALGSERGWVINNDNRWGNPTYQGGIDEVCVFNRVLDPGEIQLLFER